MFIYFILNTCGAFFCPFCVLLFSRKFYNGMLERWIWVEWSMKSNAFVTQTKIFSVNCLLHHFFFIFCVPFFFLLLTSSFTSSIYKEFLYCWPGRDLNLRPEMRKELAHITLPTELFGLTYWVSISLTFSFIHHMDSFKH